MIKKLSTIAFGLAVLAVNASGALAEDVYVYSDGSTKDYMAGVPVPAPMPVPMHDAQWYIRFDIGGSVVGDVDAEARGPGGVIVRDSDDLETSIFGEAGLGYRFSPNFRVDFTSSFHSASELTEPSMQTYFATLSAATAADPTITATNIYEVEREDKVDLRHMSTNLVNFYYDFDNQSRFTPYVGAGVGVTYIETSRRTSEVATCQDGYLTPPGPVPRTGCQADAGDPTITSSSVTNESEWLFSGALMAGFSYDFNEYVSLDMGYRVLYTPGTIQRQAPTLTGVSELEWTDFLHHQFRTGVRLNIF